MPCWWHLTTMVCHSSSMPRTETERWCSEMTMASFVMMSMFMVSMMPFWSKPMRWSVMTMMASAVCFLEIRMRWTSLSTVMAMSVAVSPSMSMAVSVMPIDTKPMIEMFSMTMSTAMSFTLAQCHSGEIFCHQILHVLLVVRHQCGFLGCRQINGTLERQAFGVFLAEPILHRARCQTDNESIQQQWLQLLLHERTFHRQRLQSGVPILHTLSMTLLGSVELGSSTEDGDLRYKLTSENLAQLVIIHLLG